MKRKIGEIYNKPIVIGDKNLVTRNEIHESELNASTGGGDTPNGGNEWEYFRVNNMRAVYGIHEIGILFTILVPYVFDTAPMPMIIDTGTLAFLGSDYDVPTIETIVNNTKGNVIKVSKFNMPKKIGDMMASIVGVPFESMDTFSEFISIGGNNDNLIPITKEEYNEEIEKIFAQYLG